MRMEFRKADYREIIVVRNAVYESFKEKTQRFLVTALVAGLVLGFFVGVHLKNSGGVLDFKGYAFISFCGFVYLDVIGLGYLMYYRKMTRILEGGFQVLKAPMVNMEEHGNIIGTVRKIGITISSDVMEENTIMPVVKKETISTRVGKKQLKAYKPNAQACLVKYDLGEGFWDEYDCIPMDF